jgi:hypothetical protein
MTMTVPLMDFQIQSVAMTVMGVMKAPQMELLSVALMDLKIVMVSMLGQVLLMDLTWVQMMVPTMGTHSVIMMERPTAVRQSATSSNRLGP